MKLPVNYILYSKKTNLIVIYNVNCLELENHEKEETARLDYEDRKSREPGEIYSNFLLF